MIVLWVNDATIRKVESEGAVAYRVGTPQNKQPYSGKYQGLNEFWLTGWRQAKAEEDEE